MKNILILGLGRFGSAMVKPLFELGNQVVVCDADEEKVNKVIDYTAGARVGDCTNEKFIQSLGVEDFDMVFVTIGESLQNSLVTVTLLKDNGAKFIYAKAGSDMHEKLLLRVGADKVAFPEREEGARVAKICGRDLVLDCIEFDGNYSIYEISVPEKWIGKSVKELNIRAKYGVNILGVKESAGKPMQPNIGAEYIFASGMQVMVMGDNGCMERLLKS